MLFTVTINQDYTNFDVLLSFTNFTHESNYLKTLYVELLKVKLNIMFPNLKMSSIQKDDSIGGYQIYIEFIVPEVRTNCFLILTSDNPKLLITEIELNRQLSSPGSSVSRRSKLVYLYCNRPTLNDLSLPCFN